MTNIRKYFMQKDGALVDHIITILPQGQDDI